MVIEVDRDDNQIGLRPREDFYTGKYIHRSAHLILLNSKNQILLQKRAANKIWFPNLIDYSVSGVVNEETYEECAIRETREEIGISVPVKFLFKYFYGRQHMDWNEQAWHAVFLGRSDDEVKPDGVEMSEVIWMGLDELKEDMKARPEIYVPHFILGMNKYFTEFDKNKTLI